MTDLPFDYGDVVERPATAERRKCSHPSRRRQTDGDGGWTCGSCGHVATREKVRMGRGARRRGVRRERRVNERVGLRNVGGANGPEDGVSTRFVAQSKAYASGRYPGWMLAELDALRTTATDDGGLIGLVRTVSLDRLPILLVSESPGRGHKARETLVVMRLDDWMEATRLVHTEPDGVE